MRTLPPTVRRGHKICFRLREKVNESQPHVEANHGGSADPVDDGKNKVDEDDVGDRKDLKMAKCQVLYE